MGVRTAVDYCARKCELATTESAILHDSRLTWSQKSDVLTHGDVFKDYVLPQMMTGDKTEWDNLSDEDEVDVHSMDDCHTRCEAQTECKQYSFVPETRQCRTRVDPRLGKQSSGTQSGWIEDRVFDFVYNSAACTDEGWQVGPMARHTKCI
jgi:hypothetical protein